MSDAPRGHESMRLEFHKILSEGRSVKYERKDDVIHLNVIVTQEDLRPGDLAAIRHPDRGLLPQDPDP